MKIKPFTFLLLLLFVSCLQNSSIHEISVSGNGRFLSTGDDDPFFWLGDTGWLLFSRLSREEAETYFEDRSRKGFTVIQVMVLHDTRNEVNVYGDSALVSGRVDQPLTTPGNSPGDPAQYDYWDHIDYLIDLAGQKGLFMALIPVWGSNVRRGRVSREQAQKYAAWLAERYGKKPNIIWLNGGDVRGSDSISVWNTIGNTIHERDTLHLISYHPFGRTQSSNWFHQEPWLDFNMFQSGHKRYDQDTAGLCYGEDNWRYVNDDYALEPVKPTLDGEPSYEGIPQGLHDPMQPRWNDADVRRYAYWSVFAGGCGFTYGNNAVMQFHKPDNPEPSYGVEETWDVAIHAPGSAQLQHLKSLMLSKPYFERVPAQDLLAGEQGERYDYLAATRGEKYAFIYTYNGRPIHIIMDKMPGPKISASWFNPRDGKYSEIGKYMNHGTKEFDPPGEKSGGNDWVLVLECQ